MLVLDMIYLNRIIKKEKSTSDFEMSFSYFGPFGVQGVIDITNHKNYFKSENNRNSINFITYPLQMAMNMISGIQQSNEI